MSEPEGPPYIDLKRQRDAAQLLLDRHLKAVGQPTKCRGCGDPIFWVTHRNGINTPYNPDGVNHFATCPNAKQFNKTTK